MGANEDQAPYRRARAAARAVELAPMSGRRPHALARGFDHGCTASAHSMAVVRPGASAPGSDSLWLGR